MSIDTYDSTHSMLNLCSNDPYCNRWRLAPVRMLQFIRNSSHFLNLLKCLRYFPLVKAAVFCEKGKCYPYDPSKVKNTNLEVKPGNPLFT